jgi:hypothetical protein
LAFLIVEPLEELEESCIVPPISSCQIPQLVANSDQSFPMLMETFPIQAKVPNILAQWKKGLGGRTRGPDSFYNLAKEANESKSDSFFRTIFNLKAKYDIPQRESPSISGNLRELGQIHQHQR